MKYRKDKNKKDVIVILGGGLVKDKNGSWKTRGLNEGGKVGGEQIRVLAGYYLYKNSKNSLILASGGKGKRLHEPTTVTISSVIKRELVELGVPKQKIIEDKKSLTTFQELKLTKKLIKEYDKVFVISNRYHLPRIRAMITYIPELKILKNKVGLISGENIVIKHDPSKWKKIISKAYSTANMEKRIAQEKEGIKALKSGSYKFK